MPATSGCQAGTEACVEYLCTRAHVGYPDTCGGVGYTRSCATHVAAHVMHAPAGCVALEDPAVGIIGTVVPSRAATICRVLWEFAVLYFE